MRWHRILFAAAMSAGMAVSLPVHAEDKMSNHHATISHPYIGMWVTGDGHIRQELLPNGRYDEARGKRQSAYQGCYVVTGNHIDYWDDTGFTADGKFVDDVLYHGGMVFYREKS
ncbi:putative ligand-binding protein with streptavidin-like fold [Neorhizobium alkalisoli]|uniref:Putative ligand-binding protein with streptavidin-like fold n=2 Tax=Neorhizobium alkalisoli TaxID=528178 RepID=A0A561QXN3_9HYPH|nr:putative ligand-binding protein with streptavidin-like fold [Neorhizobium alkalisoli]